MTEIDGYEVLGLGLYFEDLPVGRKFRTIGRTLTEADLVNLVWACISRICRSVANSAPSAAR